MFKKKYSLAAVAVAAVIGCMVGQTAKQDGESTTAAAQNEGPTRALDDQDVYYPGTENLAPDEMRVIACGTGMPNGGHGHGHGHGHATRNTQHGSRNTDHGTRNTEYGLGNKGNDVGVDRRRAETAAFRFRY